jgi:hypothetical protein
MYASLNMPRPGIAQPRYQLRRSFWNILSELADATAAGRPSLSVRLSLSELADATAAGRPSLSVRLSLIAL